MNPRSGAIDDKSPQLYSTIRSLDVVIKKMTELANRGESTDSLVNDLNSNMSDEMREIYTLYCAAFQRTEKEDHEAAIRGYKAVVELAPDFVAARLNLAIAYYKLGMDHESRSELEILLEHAPNEADIHNSMGNLYLRHDISKAISHYQAALKLNRHHVDAMLGLGCCYIGLDLFNDAEKILKQGLKLIESGDFEGRIPNGMNFEKSEFYSNLCTALELQGDRKGAIDCLRKGLKIFPNNKFYTENLKRLKDK